MIDCATAIELGSPEYMARFAARARRDRVPVSGSFDLTYRCNLRCVHCYCAHLTSESAAEAAELGTGETLRLLDEAADAGCLQMVLSGGEPLLRPDFTRIYGAASELGMLTTVFTNATLIDESILAAFRQYPPRMVEISVYGSDAATYERISGVKGSFVRAMRGIDALLDAGVRVGLKTMILRDNLHDVEAIEAMAASRGLRFRLDPLVMPRLDGDRTPMEQRVDPGAAAALEFSTEERRTSLVDYQKRQMAAPDRPDLYLCSAGLTAFHLDPRGVLRPCLMSRQYGSDAVDLGFAAAWCSAVQTIERLRRKEDSVCARCNKKALCGYCPGLLELETGSPHRHSPYMCGLAEGRSGMIEGAYEAGRS